MASIKRHTESNFRQINETLRDEIPRLVAMVTPETAATYAGSTPKAANHWQAGACIPNLSHALAMAQQIPHLRRLFLEILNAEEGGPDESAVSD